MRLHFKEYGAGQPLIILHGLFGASDNWHGIAQKLAGQHHVLCFDLRNHGQSPHSDEMNLPLMADDLEEFMADHQLIEADVVGHSLGGKVAMQFALKHSQRVRSLVVVDMAPREYTPTHGVILDAMRSLDFREFRMRSQVEAALAPAIPDAGTRRFLLKNVGSDSGGSLFWKLNLDGIYKNYHRLNEAVVADVPFERPTLFVRGEKSDYVKDSDWPLIASLFPAVRLTTVPSAGHWVHAEVPDQFLSALNEFFDAMD